MNAEEIREKRFKKGLIGYNPDEVDLFVSMIAGEVEALTSEINTSREQARALGDELGLYKNREESIKSTMMAAQRLCDDMKKNAEKECQVILSDAELRAEKLLDEARRRLARLEGEITEMKRQKIRFEESLRSSLMTHMKLLDVSKEE